MQIPEKEVIIPEGGAKPLAPYSPGIQFWRACVCIWADRNRSSNWKTGQLVVSKLKLAKR